MKLQLALTVVTIFFSFASPAQTPGLDVAKMEFKTKQVIPPGPEAAELGKYGNTPVSLFTGTPTISIPLFELKGNSLTLPISLSYNASGYKPQEEAPWVGSGWSLNGGGVITRSVQGNPDKDTTYFNSTALSPPSSNDIFLYYDYMHRLQDGRLEGQPDVYYYNFAGHSGKFFLNTDQSVIKKEKDLSIITPCMTGCGTTSFTIKDEQGITYIFDSTEATTMIPYDDAGELSYITYHFPSSWFLSKIISADGLEEIYFDYYSPGGLQEMYQDMTSNRSEAYTYGVKAPTFPACYGIVSDQEAHTQIPPNISVSRKFLKKITLKKSGETVAYIDLESVEGTRLDSDFGLDRKLTDVKLYSNNNGSNEMVKQYHLGLSYFVNMDNTTYKKRLRLDTLIELGSDGSTAKPPYLFTYNTSTGIPEKTTKGIDHWGFFNGASNSSLVPYVVFPATVLAGHYYFGTRNVGDGADREPTLAGSSATILNKIQYPTGGYTTFEYELNQAKFEDSSVHDVGGIRVKQIIDYSFDDKKATAKNYTYTRDDGTGSGFGGFYPKYLTTSTFHHYFTTYSAGMDATCEDIQENEEYYTYTMNVSCNSVYGLGSYQGSQIAYKQVTESLVDLTSNQSLGKTIYRYNVAYPSEHDDDISNGDLLEESVYDNAGKLLSQKVNTYEITGDQNIGAWTVRSKDLQDNHIAYCYNSSTGIYSNYGDGEFPPSGCGDVHLYTSKLDLSGYGYYRQNKHIVSQTQKIFDQLTNNYLFTSKKYFYDTTHNYPKIIEDSTSNGEKIVTEIKYAKDYNTSSTSGVLANDIKALVDANMPGTPIEKLQYRLYADNSRKYLNGQITDYNLNFPQQIYFLESSPPLTSVTQSSIVSGALSYNSNYRLAGNFRYDLYNNLSQQGKTGDAVKSYLWDYHFQYPVAEIISKYLGEETVSTPHGDKTLTLLPVICYTSFETDNNGNLTFSGAPQSESTAPTGKRCYSLGGGNISASVSSTITYVVSYWRNSASSYSVTGSSSVKQGGTHNGWTYFEHTVSGVSSTTISGSGLIDEVRVYPATSIMTTTTYDPLIGVTSSCDANNHITYYEYDPLGRLINVKDDDHNIVKNFKYNYGPGDSLTASATTLYYNAAAQQSFVKNNCSFGTPDTLVYQVAYGKHASVVSQTDANNMAQAEIDANGQEYANTNGGCYYYNVEEPTNIHVGYWKDDCPYASGPGNFLRYVVPAGKYKSTVSQTDANNLALAEVSANGQAYANANAGCSCETEGVRYVSGNCESGTRINDGSYQLEDLRWVCVYHYEFSDGDSIEYSEFSETCPIY